jgi:phage-related protein
MTIANLIKEKLDESMNTFESVIGKLEEKDLMVKINEGENGWTVIEILRHIQNSENGMTKNLESILKGGDGVPLNFDLMKFNTSANKEMKEISLEQILQNMRNYRKNTLAVLSNVKDNQWKLEGRHPSQEIFTVEKIFEIIWSHPIDHLKGIRAKFSI